MNVHDSLNSINFDLFLLVVLDQNKAKVALEQKLFTRQVFLFSFLFKTDFNKILYHCRCNYMSNMTQKHQGVISLLMSLKPVQQIKTR